MVAPRQPPLLDLITELLAEQGRLQTPVVHASHAYDQAAGGLPRSAISPRLIPFTTPGPGEQYAFEVDLDACTGCKACVVACHSLNGLDENEAWRDVGLVTGGSPAAPYQQTITTACHHCADPGCLNGCPVLAYEKDPITGIVRHLDDQCIGCQYCILKCPYDVPKYNERLGIVRKCDLCHQRLGAGEAPACAQACPTHAIKIVTVSLHVAGHEGPDTSAFLASAPDPAYTQPTTRYLTQRPTPPNALAADATVLRPQPPHWPLVIMLTLLPGAIVLQALLRTSLAATAPVWSAWLPVALGALGLGAATFHLGQPLRAWRVFLGLRRSWFSREAVLFGGWFGLAATAIALPFVPVPASLARLVPSVPMVANAATAVGLAGLFCSVMIYVDTQRRFWRFTQTGPRFFGTGLILALGLLTPLVAAGLLVAKLGLEALTWRGTGVSARLQRGPFRRVLSLRVTLGLLALAGLAANPTGPFLFGILAIALAGELTERYLFFRAVDAPKMPGQTDPGRPAHS